jgi:ATP-dependent helicase/DNAse subunit B
VHGDEPLASSSVCAFVLDALEASDGWKHGEIVDLLTAPWMDTDGADETLTGAIPVVCRQAGIVAGHEQWVKRLRRMRAELSRAPRDREFDAGQLLRRHPRLLDAVITAEARMKRLSRALEMFPEADELHRFCRATAHFLDALELGKAVRTRAPESIRVREIAALEALQELLGRLDARQFSTGALQTRGDFVRFLRQTCGEQTFHAPETPRERRGVRCLELRSVRGLRFRYVFAGGLNEGIVPGQPGVNAVYSEDDVRELRDAGIPLESREVRTERELAAFHHVLEAAQDRIWLFWRTATPDGKPLLRSPFLNDLLRLFAAKPVERTPLRASQYYPALSHAASHRDAINNLFATGTRLPEALAAEFAAVVRGADIEKRRYSLAVFDAFDGVLCEERNQAETAERFGEDHVFSATELEYYRQCPFRFFALRLLRLMPAERPVTAFDRGLLGIVVHQVLEKFHQHYAGKPVSEIPVREAEEAMRGVVDSVFDENSAAMITVPDGMLMAERMAVHERLQRYLTIARREEVSWRPTEFEAVFGGTREKEYPPLAILTEAGILRMRGRIDRIDQGGAGCRVVDYKTGGLPAPAQVKEGISLQLVAYALALENVIAPGTVCEEGVLLKVGTTDRLAVRESGRGTLWEEAKKGFFEGVSAALRGIRGASFPPVPQPGVCASCDARRMCRIDMSRVERKQGGAP